MSYLPHKFGRWGEDYACEILQQSGLVVIDRNIRFKFGEIDIIAKDKHILCFIEVRCRLTERFGDPKATVTKNKQMRLIKAANRYLQGLSTVPICRFDVVSIVGFSKFAQVEHIKNAFVATVWHDYGRDPWRVY